MSSELYNWELFAFLITWSISHKYIQNWWELMTEIFTTCLKNVLSVNLMHKCNRPSVIFLYLHACFEIFLCWKIIQFQEWGWNPICSTSFSPCLIALMFIPLCTFLYIFLLCPSEFDKHVALFFRQCLCIISTRHCPDGSLWYTVTNVRKFKSLQARFRTPLYINFIKMLYWEGCLIPLRYH